MNKTNLPYARKAQRPVYDFVMREYVLAYIKLFKDLYAKERDIDVEYNSIYKQYKVSIYKNCDAVGNGTPESRDKRWLEFQDAIESLFNVKHKSRSWRWIHTCLNLYDQNKEYDPPEPNYIPGYNYWIPEDQPTDTQP